MSHPSSSATHSQAEPIILDHVARQCSLTDPEPARLRLGSASVVLDGWSPSTKTAVEACARVTKPKGAAVKKPMDDAMRLILVRRTYPQARLVLAFATDEVASTFRGGRGWQGAALEAAGIAAVTADLDDDLLRDLRRATERQYR